MKQAELVYSTKHVNPKIIGIMDRVLGETGAELETRVIRSSKNKTKILSKYNVPAKAKKNNRSDQTSQALAKLNELFANKPLNEVLV